MDEILRRESPRLVAVLACALAVCCFAAAPPAGAHESTVRVALPQQPNTLDPLRGSEFYENYVDCALYSGLVVIDDRGRVTPDLAERVPTRANGGISADGRTITYHLRANALWHDGVPLTAKDVVFTFERMRDPNTGFPASSTYDVIERVAAKDSRTVVVLLRHPYADAVAEIFVNGQNGSILPMHLLEGISDLRRAPFEQHPVGSGPFVFESWRRDAALVLRANPSYFRGRPAIDRLRIEFVPDLNTVALELRAGEIDFAPNLTPAVVDAVRSTTRFRIVEAPTYTVVYLAARTDVPPFDDVRVRRALGLAIDRRSVALKAYLGRAEPAAELVPPRSPFATRRTAPPADPAAARALLDAAGWRVEADGIRVKGARRLALTLTTIAGARALLATATQLQAAFRSIGVDAGLRPLQSNVLFAPDGVLPRGDFSFALIAEGFATTADRSTVLGSRSIPPNGTNYARYRNADVDREIDAARVSLEPRTRRRAFERIATRIAADAPYVPIVWTHATFAIAPALDGVRPETANSDFWNVYDWQMRPQ